MKGMSSNKLETRHDDDLPLKNNKSKTSPLNQSATESSDSRSESSATDCSGKLDLHSYGRWRRRKISMHSRTRCPEDTSSSRSASSRSLTSRSSSSQSSDSDHNVKRQKLSPRVQPEPSDYKGGRNNNKRPTRSRRSDSSSSSRSSKSNLFNRNNHRSTCSDSSSGSSSVSPPQRTRNLKKLRKSSPDYRDRRRITSSRKPPVPLHRD